MTVTIRSPLDLSMNLHLATRETNVWVMRACNDKTLLDEMSEAGSAFSLHCRYAINPTTGTVERVSSDDKRIVRSFGAKGQALKWVADKVYDGHYFDVFDPLGSFWETGEAIFEFKKSPTNENNAYFMKSVYRNKNIVFPTEDKSLTFADTPDAIPQAVVRIAAKLRTGLSMTNYHIRGHYGAVLATTASAPLAGRDINADADVAVKRAALEGTSYNFIPIASASAPNNAFYMRNSLTGALIGFSSTFVFISDRPTGGSTPGPAYVWIIESASDADSPFKSAATATNPLGLFTIKSELTGRFLAQMTALSAASPVADVDVVSIEEKDNASNPRLLWDFVPAGYGDAIKN